LSRSRQQSQQCCSQRPTGGSGQLFLRRRPSGHWFSRGPCVGVWLSPSCRYGNTETSDRHSFERGHTDQQSQRAATNERAARRSSFPDHEGCLRRVRSRDCSPEVGLTSGPGL